MSSETGAYVSGDNLSVAVNTLNSVSAPGGLESRQLSFDELDTPLRETTFVVVDLETTGMRSGDDAITELGAVKIRSGEVIGEMATLVDPGRNVPPYIVEITGITTAMVTGAPRIEEVLPAFLEFAQGAVLVAHNAPFDIGFLKTAAARSEIAWPAFTVLCTVKLARRILTRDEAPSVKLSFLARLFDVGTTPTHRALDDARATVEVLHALIDRVGNQGVHSLTELVDYLPGIAADQRAKRSLAGHLPHAPGVYLFRGPSEEVLYVGTASNLHRRVRNYFTGSETRGRMKEMVALATRIDHVECTHALEAGVRELRLISAHTPPYNRRSKYPKRGWWIVLTVEAFPRLSLARIPTMDALGPFQSRGDAADVADVLAEFCGIRTCTIRIAHGQLHGPKCPPRELGSCPASENGPRNEEDYRPGPQLVRDVFRGLDDTPLLRMRERIEELAAAELFEGAARLRDRLTTFTLALHRMQKRCALAALDELVVARPRGEGGWQFAVIRSGRLASAGVSARGVHPMPVVEAITLAAETVIPEPTPLRGASPDEIGLLLRWLESEDTRIVRASAGYAEPARGAGPWLQWCDMARAGSLADADADAYAVHD